MATTAELRTAALAAARRLDYAEAASLYDQAIAAYPGKGTLADMDKAGMAQRRDGCLGMLKTCLTCGQSAAQCSCFRVRA